MRANTTDKTDQIVRQFWDMLAVWSQKTFGSDKDRGPIGPLKHLQKEVEEVLKEPYDLIEYADMVHLVFDACRRAGFQFNDLLYACMTKLIINQHREWAKPTTDEPVEHVK